MNVLLWRSEYQRDETYGSEVSLQAVLGKILTAPDNSQLEVKQRGRTLGFCRWSPEVVATSPAQKTSTETGVEDMVTRLANYRISIDGNISLPGISNRVRVEFTAVLTTNRDWQEFSMRVALRPDTWEIHSVAAEKILHFKMEDGAGNFERTFSFSELHNPQALLREFAGPIPLTLLTDAGLPMESTPASGSLALGLAWTARETWLKLGHSSIRVYRLETRLLDRYPVVLIVSRAGEILQVRLPNEVRFTNEQLAEP
jgi:hypothetical protein